MSSIVEFPDVLTLDEVSDYLRLSREVIEQEAAQGHLPGKRILDEWRFLKTAVDEWLKTPDGKTSMLRQVASFADDKTMSDMREVIYADRGRSEAVNSSS